jgi:hypothetical protein
MNYSFGISQAIHHFNEIGQYFTWVGIFCVAFGFPYGLTLYRNGEIKKVNRNFIILLLIAPALFAWKMSFDINLPVSSDKLQNVYWNQVLYWPIKMVMMIFSLFLIWRLFDRDTEFYGIKVRGLKWKPYGMMLLFMVPLIVIASTQPDFLKMYPKLKNMDFMSAHGHAGWYRILYELAYGTDFISIELFFRGFLVLAFAKWVGKDAILPMACFYCTIHFGKPLGECISSFFGGIILGIVSYHTRSVLGGLMVHLGIAWMMELGGILGNTYFT